MEFNLYAVRDEKLDLNRFGAVICQENDAAAMRSFAHECMNKDSLWHTHPSDYSLWCLGVYDMSVGQILPDQPRKVCDATNFVKE